jgi:minor extracellular serine protease Vpr
MGNRKWQHSLLPIALLLAASVSAANAQEQVTQDLPGQWFVQLASPPTADGANAATIQQEQNNFRAAMAAAGIPFVENYAYQTLANGLSIGTLDIKRVLKLPGVRSATPIEVMTYEPPQLGDSPEMAAALQTTGAAYVQSTLGYTGAGVNIAIVDTGIDYHHPDLGGCFGPGCKVAKGWDFVGDAFTGSNAQVPDPDPDDHCAGHGSHVAGIAAGSSTWANGVTGVAPGATLFAYRVFGCTGTARTDTIAAAMERAYLDGANVINMSLGSSRNWPNGIHSVMATKLAQKGVVTVASAGNDAGGGAYAGGSPGAGVDIIGVASFENEQVWLPYFTASPDDAQIGFQVASGGAGNPSTSGTYPLARTGTTATADDACAALPAGSLTGMVALIRRGTCGFNVKANNARDAGAVGVVIYNNAAGRISASVAGPPAATIPVVTITAADGAVLDARIAAGATTLTLTDQLGTFTNAPNGGLIAGLLPSGTTASSNTGSTYGPSPTLDIKPDIGAPGGTIRSTYPVPLGSYAVLSGTSMASPHVAGAVALLLQAKPGLTPGEVRTILQNSAKPRFYATATGSGAPDLEMVHRQGAGMLDIAQAVQAQVTVTPGKLSLGENESGGAQTRTLTLKNDGLVPVTYTLGAQAAVGSTGTYFAPNTQNLFTPVRTQPSTVTFSSPTVVVPAGGTATVNASVAPAAGLANKALYGGWITFTPDGGGAVYRVPYMGFKGDYQSIQTLTFPGSFLLIGHYNVGTGACTGQVAWSAAMAAQTFSFSATDQVCVRFHVDHPAARVQLNVRNAANTSLIGKAFEANYLGRNSNYNSVYLASWDGVAIGALTSLALPNGAYTLQLQALKANGSASNPAHLETYTFPIIVAR